VETCFAVLTDFAAYPDWSSPVRECAVLTRHPDGLPHHVSFVLDTPIKTIRYTRAYTWDPPHGGEWELVSGDVAGVEGSYEFVPSRTGCTATCTQATCAYTYAAGTVVTVTRQTATNDLWVGACDGATGGGLKAKTCTLRLNSNELLGAGLESVGAIPPAKPAALTVKVSLSGKGRGTVTGTLVNGSGSINCGSRCTVTGDRNEQVRLTAKVTAGKWRWSDRWPSASRTSIRSRWYPDTPSSLRTTTGASARRTAGATTPTTAEISPLRT